MRNAAAERSNGEQGDPTARARMLAEVREGLTAPQKELAPKYFYDARGCRLFEEITTLPEYYLTRVERALLEGWAASWVREFRPSGLVELGAGNASKTRILLDAMRPGSLFVPLDVSAELLRDTADALRDEYPHLTVTPEVGDLTRPLALSVDLPRPVLFAFLGSTIGNFTRPAAVRLLAHVRATMQRGDRLLLGADLRPGGGKSLEEVEAAYNDSRGVTAEFNLNVLRVLNREIGTDFDLRAFSHVARYDTNEGRIEMHLVAIRPQVVNLPGSSPIRFRRGESVRTEISCKYDRTELDGLFAAAGLVTERWCEDEGGRYALVLAGVRSS